MSMTRFLESRTLFDAEIAEAVSAAAPPWSPLSPPILNGIHEIELDFETTGTEWWNGDRPIGVAIGWSGQTQYLSWGHATDHPRHDEAAIKRWFHEQLRGKRITNANTKFENHFAREWGFDFEAHGCILSDVQHHAALLDDHRRKFSQEVLCEEFLPGERKVTVVNGELLDATRMASYPPGFVAVRAEADVRQVRLLKELFIPRLYAEGLMQVLALEDECTYATCEMEANAAVIDEAKLRRWAKEARRDLEKAIMGVHALTGLRFSPDKPDDWKRLFRARNVETAEVTAMGKPSFTGAAVDAVIKASNDEAVILARRAARLADLLSKYLDKYIIAIDGGRLRFSLHQLRSDEGGTITGRFSASAVSVSKRVKKGFNPQQVLATEKQLADYGPDFIIRELFIAADSREQVISADSAQQEYRLMAHYANNPKIIQAYRDDPWLSFHKLVHGMILPYKPDLSYKSLKNLNFMSIYGGGIVKLANMMGFITQRQADELNQMNYAERVADQRLAQALQVKNVYDRMLPEVEPLAKRTSGLAETRGWVKTFMGRRMRFPDKQRLHKALNGIIQGGAGDIMKIKMIEVHKAAGSLGFTPRLTIHDQILGDGTATAAVELTDLLNRQSYDLRVPILWEVKARDNWAACDAKEIEIPRGFGDATRGGR